ncbi:MAG: hypothetical protein F4038_03275 [Chloroflexi bacterium]|nr:hypothetical protein [Chloroflexota bacterium]MYG90465.1 hypothetical protein [Chloroflexota bacterium]MYJ92059.1 hypothetical protein [Chloroflexota bacterium]
MAPAPVRRRSSAHACAALRPCGRRQMPGWQGTV